MNKFLKIANELVGKRLWDPEKYHCYHLVKEIYLKASGVKLPDYFFNGNRPLINKDIIEEKIRGNVWEKIKPEDRELGDVVLMGSKHCAFHVGVYVGSDNGLDYYSHISEDVSGSCIMPEKNLKRYKWVIHTFLRYRGQNVS